VPRKLPTADTRSASKCLSLPALIAPPSTLCRRSRARSHNARRTAVGASSWKPLQLRGPPWLSAISVLKTFARPTPSSRAGPTIPEKKPCPTPLQSVSNTSVKREELATRSPASPPERIAALLSVVRILLGYGRHLADTINHRAAAPSFTTIAACFGTIDLPVILGHLHRGILRAAALERLLLARAARGGDVAFTRCRIRAQGRKPAAADADHETANPAARKPAPRPLRRFPHNADADFHTPTLQEIERQVRSRPVGRTIVDICLDLAVVPGFCTGPFWNALFDAMHWYGGSTASVMREKHRREQAFHREQDKSPAQGWYVSHQRRELMRQVLGFFIGEQPVLPFPPSAIIAPAAAAATGPP
jgi:hypothetical protein